MILNIMIFINPISHGVFFPWLPLGGRGADAAHLFGKPRRASFKILTSFEKKNTLIMTWKKFQNPKDEVSSSKIDEMAKDWKIVAKSQNW